LNASLRELNRLHPTPYKLLLSETWLCWWGTHLWT